MAGNSLILADDATGALEVGALLAGSGLRAEVELEPGSGQAAQVRVRLLATRHVDEQQARAMVTEAVRGWRGDLLYWKTDSTLRGPIGTCFEALLTAFPERRIVYLPAYPAVGRTVRQGRLFVHGVAVEETEFARDILNPVGTGVVREVLAAAGLGRIDEAANCSQLREWLRSGGGRVVVCDAESEAQMAALVNECRDHVGALILAGPAGVMRHWSGAGAVPVWPHVEEWGVVCGSLHPVSRAQARAAEGLGLDVRYGLEEAGEAAGLMIFGGDTALAVWRALGITRLEALGEILPGVAVSRGRGRVFVTKAGGYGDVDLVQEVLKRWNA